MLYKETDDETYSKICNYLQKAGDNLEIAEDLLRKATRG